VDSDVLAGRINTDEVESGARQCRLAHVSAYGL
jgi:hypothetical protein